MKKYLIAALCILVLAGGCDIVIGKKIAEEADRVEKDAPDFAEAVDSVASAVESVSKPISGGSAEKGAGIADGVESAANSGKAVVETVRPFVPEKYVPIADAATGVLGALATIAGLAAGIFRKRQKKAEAVRDVAIKAGNATPGYGEVVTKEALKAGVADATEAAYKATLEK